MKRKIAIATLSVLPLAVGSVYASGQSGIVIASSLNIRSGAGTSYNVLFTVKKNEKVDILQSSKGWYKIKSNSGKEGWASADYIKIDNSSNDNNQNSTGKTKIVTASSLNMRNGAGTSYRVIMTLKKGTKVEVISESNGWSKIKYDGRLGYVSSQYLSSSTSGGSSNDNSSNNNTSKSTKEVTASSLNVRSGAGTNYGVIGSLKKGAKVEVISESNGWSKIKFNGKDGYVSSSYLKNVSSTPNPMPPDDGNNTGTVTKEVNNSYLNVRSGPGTNHSLVGKLYKGDKVGVISEANGWSKIKFNGKDAHVSSQYLSKVNESGGGTNPTPPPVTGGESTENVNGATINYKALSYTLNDHINAQIERVSVGGNVIDSSKPRIHNEVRSLMSGMTRAFVPAGKDDIEYFLNPKNFTNSKKGMLQFLRIDSYKGGISASELNSYLNSLAPGSNGKNVFHNQGQAFINAAQKYNIDLVYLVAHSMWETAYGKSTLAQGQTLTSFKGKPLDKPVTVYNFFGIGAIDGSANLSGAEAAYSNGWTSVEATIDGSAGWIAKNYVKSSKYNQNTVYKMKFNYEYTWHQYATDVNWANGVSGIMVKLIDMYDTGKNLTFDVPQYK